MASVLRLWVRWLRFDWYLNVSAIVSVVAIWSRCVGLLLRLWVRLWMCLWVECVLFECVSSATVLLLWLRLCCDLIVIVRVIVMMVMIVIMSVIVIASWLLVGRLWCDGVVVVIVIMIVTGCWVCGVWVWWLCYCGCDRACDCGCECGYELIGIWLIVLLGVSCVCLRLWYDCDCDGAWYCVLSVVDMDVSCWWCDCVGACDCYSVCDVCVIVMWLWLWL